MRSFETPLIVTPLDDGRRWRLVEPFRYHRDTEVIHVPAGYETDFASIPRLFWRILPPWGKYGKASVVHDYLCDLRDRPSEEVHMIFREAMAALGVSAWKRNVMYAAVRCCGPKF